jgi:hypothetical protein
MHFLRNTKNKQRGAQEKIARMAAHNCSVTYIKRQSHTIREVQNETRTKEKAFAVQILGGIQQKASNGAAPHEIR